MDKIDVEVYEPDSRDEYYDAMCKVAYAQMFSGRSDRNVYLRPSVDRTDNSVELRSSAAS